MGQMIKVEAVDDSGEFSAYLAMPEKSNAPAIVVIQEIFGVNAGMRQICDDLASQGFIAISPDLFWRQEPDVQLTDKTQEEWDKAFALLNGFDMDKGVADIAATLNAARAMPECNGKAGAVGYCLGGRLAYLTAAHTDVDAAVGYYGVTIDTLLDKAKTITVPVILHIAEEDGFVDKEAQAKIHAGLDDHEYVTLYDYPGVDHAFARPNGVNWNAEAATLANKRTSELFNTLKS